MSVRNKFLIILGVIFAISLSYYLFSTPRSQDLVLIGTVDSNQVVVSPQIQGRIVKLLVDEGTQVKQGDLIRQNCRPKSVPPVLRLPACARKWLKHALPSRQPQVPHRAT